MHLSSLSKRNVQFTVGFIKSQFILAPFSLIFLEANSGSATAFTTAMWQMSVTLRCK